MLVYDINVMKDQCVVRVYMLTVLIKYHKFIIIISQFFSSGRQTQFIFYILVPITMMHIFGIY